MHNLLIVTIRIRKKKGNKQSNFVFVQLAGNSKLVLCTKVYGIHYLSGI